MIDKNLYCETFSRLHASEEAKKEVFQNMQEKKNQRRMPKLLRTSAIAAAMVCVLAVSAGAADLATGGAFFRSLRQVWTDGYETRYEAVDEDGGQYELSIREGAVLTEEDGRLMLHAAGEDIDITDELAETGAYHYEKALKNHIVAVDVAGTPEEWTLTETVTDEDGDTYTSAYTSDDAVTDVNVAGIDMGTVFVKEDGEDGGEETVTVTTTENSMEAAVMTEQDVE